MLCCVVLVSSCVALASSRVVSCCTRVVSCCICVAFCCFELCYVVLVLCHVVSCYYSCGFLDKIIWHENTIENSLASQKCRLVKFCKVDTWSQAAGASFHDRNKFF